MTKHRQAKGKRRTAWFPQGSTGNFEEGEEREAMSLGKKSLRQVLLEYYHTAQNANKPLGQYSPEELAGMLLSEGKTSQDVADDLRLPNSKKSKISNQLFGVEREESTIIRHL